MRKQRGRRRCAKVSRRPGSLEGRSRGQCFRFRLISWSGERLGSSAKAVRRWGIMCSRAHLHGTRSAVVRYSVARQKKASYRGVNREGCVLCVDFDCVKKWAGSSWAIISECTLCQVEAGREGTWDHCKWSSASKLPLNNTLTASKTKELRFSPQTQNEGWFPVDEPGLAVWN